MKFLKVILLLTVVLAASMAVSASNEANVAVKTVLLALDAEENLENIDEPVCPKKKDCKKKCKDCPKAKECKKACAKSCSEVKDCPKAKKCTKKADCPKSKECKKACAKKKACCEKK